MNIKHPTPEQRAAELYSHMQLHNPRVTAWDLICFATETLAIFAGTDYDFLKEPVQHLVSVVYTAHNAMDDMPSCLSNSQTSQSQDTTKQST